MHGGKGSAASTHLPLDESAAPKVRPLLELGNNLQREVEWAWGDCVTSEQVAPVRRKVGACPEK